MSLRIGSRYIQNLDYIIRLKSFWNSIKELSVRTEIIINVLNNGGSMEYSKTKYKLFPTLSPYISIDRFEKLKEDHKFIMKKIQSLFNKDSAISIVDIGCGNGEFLYHLKKAFPNCKLTGFDLTEEFINTGKNFPGLKGVRLEQKDFLEVDEIFDLVICSGMFHIFTDIKQPIEKFLSICKGGGYLFVDGLFNEYDIEVRMQYCDNSNPISKGIWRSDWNQHSQSSVKNFLKGIVEYVEFEEVVFDLELPMNAAMPINKWTFKDSKGKTIITNGTHLISNKTLMMIKK